MNNNHKDLLLEVFSYHADRVDDTQTNNFIKSYLDKHNLQYNLDDYGNIYVEKGTNKIKPSFVCHTDTVQNIIKNEEYDIHYSKDEKAIFAINNTDYSRASIKGDDQVGIFICLRALTDPFILDLKVVFFRFEETGCKGSNKCDMKFFTNASFVLQADRRGSSDFICYSNGTEIHGKEFILKCEDLLNSYKYKTSSGTCTDVGELTVRGIGIATANISCGYYDAHTKNEYVIVDEIENCYNLMKNLAMRLGSEIQHFTPPVVKYISNDYDNFKYNDGFKYKPLYNLYNNSKKVIQKQLNGLKKVWDEESDNYEISNKKDLEEFEKYDYFYHDIALNWKKGDEVDYSFSEIEKIAYYFNKIYKNEIIFKDIINYKLIKEEYYNFYPHDLTEEDVEKEDVKKNSYKKFHNRSKKKFYF